MVPWPKVPLMDVEQLDELIEIGEGYTVELKKTASHISREICAFANAAGGNILIGVDDHGLKTGVSDLNRTASAVQATARNLDPPLVLDIQRIESVLVVTVPSGPNKPYSANGRFYVREAANCQQMNRDDIREFFFKEGLIRFDEQPCTDFDMRRDLDAKKYAAFRQAADIPAKLRRGDVLRNLQLITDRGMSNAGVLLLSKNVPKFFLQASLTCALFQGTTKTKILDQATFQGDIAKRTGSLHPQPLVGEQVRE